MTAAPPQAAEAEQALVGSLLVDRDAIAAVDWLPPTAFSLASTRYTFEAVLDLWRRRVPADLVTVSEELARRDRLDAIGGVAALSAFATAVPTSAHAPYYARRVATCAKARRYVDLGTAIAAGAYASEDYDPGEAIRAAAADIDALEDPAERGGPVAYADLMPDFVEELLNGWAGEVTNAAVPTGFRWLDDALDGGFRPAELALLGARPSMGKSAFALHLAHAAARHRGGTGGSVVFFSAEMSVRSLVYRAASEVTGVPGAQIRSGKIPIDLRDRVLFATDAMAGLPVLIDDTSGITTAQMIARVQRLQRDGRVSLVVFDYIEIAGDQNASEELRVGRIGAQLKHLAKVCDVPVVALCQLSRAVEQRKDKRPQLSDLRYSGALEAHADVVLFLFREGYYVAQGLLDPTPGKEDVTEVILAKQRNGVTGTFPVRWYPEQMAFSDLDVDRRMEWAR
jgi:replicative DNA helicase